MTGGNATARSMSTMARLPAICGAGGLGEAGHHRLPCENPLEGYRRLTFMMLDADIVAASPSSVWRVLSQAGLLSKWTGKPSKKGTGFEQPLMAHQHWHI